MTVAPTPTTPNSNLFGKAQAEPANLVSVDIKVSPELKKLLDKDFTPVANIMRADLLATKLTNKALAGKNALERSVLLAKGVQFLREMLDEKTMAHFEPLYNSPLGFRCDRPNKKNKEAYSMHEVRECMIQALLIGLEPIGNLWNIIGGRMYITREGFTRLLLDLEEERGLTDLRIEFGVPEFGEHGGALVPCRAGWIVGGKKGHLPDVKIPVETDDYSSVDQVLGKADRKMKCRVYNLITGSTFTVDGEAVVHSESSGTWGKRPESKPDEPSALEEVKRQRQESRPQQAAENKPEPAKVDENAAAKDETRPVKGNPDASGPGVQDVKPEPEKKLGIGDARAQPTDSDLGKGPIQATPASMTTTTDWTT